MSLSLFEFYKKCLYPMTPSKGVEQIMQCIMHGGDTTEDYVELLSGETELQKWLRLSVQRLGFYSENQSLHQIVTLLGQDRVRDLIIGRQIERSFVPVEQSFLSRAQEESQSERELHSQAAEKLEKSKRRKQQIGEKIASDLEGDGGKIPESLQAQIDGEAEEIEDPGAADENQEIIPQVALYGEYLSHSKKAESIAVSIRNSYPGRAFCGGVLFDYLFYFLKTLDLENNEKVHDARIKSTDDFVSHLFGDGLRTGVAANEMIQKISIKQQRNVFVTAMLRNFGKGLLLAFDPEKFEKAYSVSTGVELGEEQVESDESESIQFDFDHAQAGALFFGRTGIFAEIERSIDYHHHPHLLRFSDPNLYALSCILNVSGKLNKQFEQRRHADPNIGNLKDKGITQSDEFKFLKLSLKDWQEIKANYALKLMKVGI